MGPGFGPGLDNIFGFFWTPDTCVRDNSSTLYPGTMIGWYDSIIINYVPGVLENYLITFTVGSQRHDHQFAALPKQRKTGKSTEV